MAQTHVEGTSAALIAGVPLLASLAVEDVAGLASSLHEVRLEPGELLIQEGDSGRSMYFLVEGEVEAVKALGTAEERHLRVHEAGSFFGEMSLIDPDGLRTASIRTLTPVLMLELPQRAFTHLVQTQPLLAFEMVRVLSLRLRDSDNAVIGELREKNLLLTQAYEELKAAQEQIIAKQKLDHELAMARQVQESILPRRLPRLGGFDFGARIAPAREVGGDLFDVIALGRDSVGIVIGDVSDKGMPAAIFMALTSSLVRALARPGAPPAVVLEGVNRLLHEMNESGMFVTLLYGVLQGRSRRFSYARAGHDVPMLFDAEGQRLGLPQRPGRPLGVFPESKLDEQTIVIPWGGTLLLYSDGATDMTDAEGALFGHERLVKAARESLNGAASDTCEALLRLLLAFQGKASQADDVTLLAIRSQPIGAAGAKGVQ